MAMDDDDLYVYVYKNHHRTKTIIEADTHKPRRETAKELAKSMSYSVRVWRERCDDSA